MRFKSLRPGDPAPWFTLPTPTLASHSLDTAAGRYIVLCFFGSAADRVGREALAAVHARGKQFDDLHASFFGITIDPADRQRLNDRVPGLRFYFDFEGEASKLYGAIAHDAAKPGPGMTIRRLWFVLDPTLRIMKVWHYQNGVSPAGEVLDYVKGLPPPSRHAGFETPAPVLVLPDVFDPGFCADLITLYRQHGGTPTGFMTELDGKTVLQDVRTFKSRSDFTIASEEIRMQCRSRIFRAIVPEIRRIHHFEVTRIERYLVACYAAEEQGHFDPHRDNSTRGTAHRRFAVSINLNADFEGGDIQFPEYGSRAFKPPPGGAVVFSCSMLHAVTPVTHGRRYAFLPFLYDEAAAALREQNNKFLGDGVGKYDGSL